MWIRNKVMFQLTCFGERTGTIVRAILFISLCIRVLLQSWKAGVPRNGPGQFSFSGKGVWRMSSCTKRPYFNLSQMHIFTFIFCVFLSLSLPLLFIMKCQIYHHLNPISYCMKVAYEPTILLRLNMIQLWLLNPIWNLRPTVSLQMTSSLWHI